HHPGGGLMPPSLVCISYRNARPGGSRNMFTPLRLDLQYLHAPVPRLLGDLHQQSIRLAAEVTKPERKRGDRIEVDPARHCLALPGGLGPPDQRRQPLRRLALLDHECAYLGGQPTGPPPMIQKQSSLPTIPNTASQSVDRGRRSGYCSLMMIRSGW